MSDFIVGKIMQLSESMGKMQALFTQIMEKQKTQETEDKEMRQALGELKGSFDGFLKAVEKAMPDININANSISTLDASTTTTQNIKKDGEKN